MDLSRNILPAFATPVVNYRFDAVDELNKKLVRLILHESESSAGITKSNVGGWHSPLDFLQREQSAISEIHKRLLAVCQSFCGHIVQPASAGRIKNFRLEGWANVLKFGQYNTLHCHPNAFWSGVYFVNGNEQVDGQPLSGRLELLDPRPGASNNYTEFTNLYGRFLINPQPGQLVLFPSWLQHQVHPYFGSGSRISIAFNLLAD